MKNANTMLSITGKVLGNIWLNHDGFGYDHMSGAWEGGFDTWQDARDAFMAFHNEWFENNCD